MSVLPEKCHTWYLWGADSKPDLKFCFMANLGQKRQSCPFYLKIDTRSIFEVLIPKLHWDFRNSDLKIHFWANLGRTSQKFSFFLKISIHGILEEMIRKQDFDFQNSGTKINFWAILDRKSIPCLFLFFKTLLLFFDIQLILVLYLRIALQSSATFFRWVWKYELPVFLF